MTIRKMISDRAFLITWPILSLAAVIVTVYLDPLREPALYLMHRLNWSPGVPWIPLMYWELPIWCEAFMRFVTAPAAVALALMNLATGLAHRRHLGMFHDEHGNYSPLAFCGVAFAAALMVALGVLEMKILGILSLLGYLLLTIAVFCHWISRGTMLAIGWIIICAGITFSVPNNGLPSSWGLGFTISGAIGLGMYAVHHVHGLIRLCWRDYKKWRLASSSC